MQVNFPSSSSFLLLGVILEQNQYLHGHLICRRLYIDKLEQSMQYHSHSICMRRVALAEIFQASAYFAGEPEAKQRSSLWKKIKKKLSTENVPSLPSSPSKISAVRAGQTEKQAGVCIGEVRENQIHEYSVYQQFAIMCISATRQLMPAFHASAAQIGPFATLTAPPRPAFPYHEVLFVPSKNLKRKRLPPRAQQNTSYYLRSYVHCRAITRGLLHSQNEQCHD